MGEELPSHLCTSPGRMEKIATRINLSISLLGRALISKQAVTSQLHTVIFSSDCQWVALYDIKHSLGFPGGAVVKSPPTNAGDTGSSPGPGRSHMPRSN